MNPWIGYYSCLDEKSKNGCKKRERGARCRKCKQSEKILYFSHKACHISPCYKIWLGRVLEVYYEHYSTMSFLQLTWKTRLSSFIVSYLQLSPARYFLLLVIISFSTWWGVENFINSSKAFESMPNMSLIYIVFTKMLMLSLFVSPNFLLSYESKASSSWSSA